MENKKIEALLDKIEQIKIELSRITDMRPGSVTQQYRKRGDKKWACWQISYTLGGVSKTEYVRDKFLEKIKEEVEEYKRYKKLSEKLVEMNVALSKERIKFLK